MLTELQVFQQLSLQRDQVALAIEGNEAFLKGFCHGTDNMYVSCFYLEHTCLWDKGDFFTVLKQMGDDVLSAKWGEELHWAQALCLVFVSSRWTAIL